MDKMEEKNTAKITIDPVSAAVYKWIKLSQSIILMVLGIIFFVLGRMSRNGGIKEEALSYSIGVVFAVYGIRNLLSGYLLNRNVTNSDVISGLRAIAFSIVLFFNTDIITVRFPVFIRAFLFALSARMILTGVDRVIGKGVKKSITGGVLYFIGSALVIGGTTAYLVFYVKKNPELFRYVLRILGILIFALGIVSGVRILVRAHNTKKIRKEEAFNQPATENRSTEVINKDVRVISLSDLKKSGRKSTNRAGYKAAEERKQIEDTKEENQDGNKEEPKNDNTPTVSYEPKEETEETNDSPKGRKNRRR